MDTLAAVNEFKAPYLVEKLRCERMVRSIEEGERLVEELKRYLFLDATYRKVFVPMFSRRVDEAWHQFILFTAEYTEFCTRLFGRYLQHQPTMRAKGPSYPQITWDQFRAIYAEHFGEEPCDHWNDAEWIAGDTRFARVEHPNPQMVRRAGDVAELVVVREPEHVALRVAARAAPALAFVLRAKGFYVRELPELEARDQASLARALMQVRAIRMSP